MGLRSSTHPKDALFLLARAREAYYQAVNCCGGSFADQDAVYSAIDRVGILCGFSPIEIAEVHKSLARLCDAMGRRIDDATARLSQLPNLTGKAPCSTAP